jgi:hypothetical protein
MVIRLIRCGLWGCLLTTGLSLLQAQPLALESFTSGTDGWTVVNWDGTGTPWTPNWNATGGNPDGYVRGDDRFVDGFWRAPASFHGDWSSAYGGTLSYDAFATLTGWVMNDIFLVGNGQTLTLAFPTNPPTSWKTFTVKLDVTAAWQYGMVYTGVSSNATEAQIRSVLANVTDLRIREEYAYGNDDSALDNVTVTPAPGSVPQPQFTNTVWRPGWVDLTLQNLLAGASYQVEQKPFVTAAQSWQPATNFVATNTSQTFSVPATNTLMFYRAKSP